MSILYKKRVCITGATGGLGQALAYRFAQEDCKLLLTARNQEKLEALEDALDQTYDTEIEVVAADLSQMSGIQYLTDEMKALGGVDVLVNNAAVFPVKSFLEVSLEDYTQCFDLNVRAPFLLAQAVISASFAHGHGWARIVNIGSSSAFGASKNTSLYAASKHALLGVSRALKSEFTKTDVQTYSVNPGSIQTEMGKQVPNQNYDTFLFPEEVADTVIFLLQQKGNLLIDEIRLNRKVIE